MEQGQEAAPSPTLTIDDPRNGGSDDRAWHTAIAHTPALRVQLPDEFAPAGEQRAESE